MTGRPATVALSRAFRSLGRDERGASAIEAAVILPILFTLTIGAIEIGRALSFQASIRHAVQETARYATVHGFASGAAATAADLETMAANLTDLPDATLTVVASFNPDNRPGSEVSVSIDHAYTPLTGAVFDVSGFTLSSTTTLTIIR